MLARLFTPELDIAQRWPTFLDITPGPRPMASIQYGISAIAFWSAIGLPLVYLPLLAQGIDSISGLAFVLGLIEFHLVALFFGHGHQLGNG